MDIVRLVITACAVATLIFIGALVFDPSRGQDVTEAIRTDLQGHTNSADLTRRVDDALSRGDFEEAQMYAEIADFTGIPVAPQTQQRLSDEGDQTRQLATGAGGFADLTDSTRRANTGALAGAVAADLTMIGDLRDISAEGRKLISGQAFDELLLELSVVGIGLTTQFSRSSAVALPAKVAVSVLKVADRTGTLTPAFAKFLLPRLRHAVDMDALGEQLRSVNLADAVETRRAVEGIAARSRTATIFTTLVQIESLRNAAGAGEAVRLLQFVDTPDDLDELVRLADILGPKTRGVIELAGRSNPRYYRHLFNLLPLLLGNLASLAAWGASLAAIFVSRKAFHFAGA